MINWGGWLLLMLIFTFLLLIIQRAEPSRRLPTFLIMIGVVLIVWLYGLYRMSNECHQPLNALCRFDLVRADAIATAWRTNYAAVSAALVFNFLFWFVIGRYNPPRTSDAIRVLGMND